MNRIKLAFLTLLMVSSLAAQDLSKLTPQQLEAYKKYTSGKASTTTTNAPAEFEERTLINEDGEKPKIAEADQKVKKTIAPATPTEISTVFGSQLFSKENLTFEPKLNIATPTNYVLGTYDEVMVDISGLYEASYKLKVSPEGTIRIPNVGPVKVAGSTIENATRAIRNQVGKIYMGVSSGETHVNVSLGNIRSIRVSVVGEATRPGSYTLPSLATAFNALYACGGPNAIGSMRDIKVIRGNKVVANLDVYSYLFDGVLSENVGLHDGDIIKVEPYVNKVTISGAVKHPAVFETTRNETLQQLVRYAGGFADNAYKLKLTVLRLNAVGKTVVDVTDKQLSSFKLMSGDSCFVSTTAINKYDNRVDLTGAVLHPGTYALESGLTVKQLVEKAGGLKDDAFLNMAYINRKQLNQIPEIIGFNLGEVLKGTANDILLQKDDSLVIKSLFDYREEQAVEVMGAVNNPGKFKFVENITLKDVIFKANGFKAMAMTDSVELVRVIRDPEQLLNTNEKTIVFKFALDKELNFKKGVSDMVLQNGDRIIVRTIAGYEDVRMVKVEGEVLRPGAYNITNKAERISDVIRRAGGFTRYAYPLGAFLIRTEKTTGIEQRMNELTKDNTKKQLQSKNDNKLDATLLKTAGMASTGVTAMDSIQKANQVEKIFKNEGVVGINLDEIMKNPGGKKDFFLEEGDNIYVPRELQTVRVVGEVLFPTYVGYQKGMSLGKYINNAGGFSIQAEKKKVFVLYANGTAKSTNRFMWIRFYPKIQPGARIIVPEKPAELKAKLSPGENIAVLTSVTSVVALIYSMLK
ncbi:MAG: SLBB domain-containing protein [Paludibacter sp.]|nr:SLBB domain-containing protein [Paludibacter sp.]